MTAVRVVTDHKELENVGSTTHSSIDDYVNNTTYVIVSGTVGPVPPSARKLVAGANITITDNGPGNDLVISTSAVISGSSQSISWMETPSGLVNGSNATFTLSHPPNPSSACMFFMNGILQLQGLLNDYTLSSNVITLNGSYRSGSNISSTYPY